MVHTVDSQNPLYEHFTSFGNSLSKDILPGFKDYAKTIKPQDNAPYETFYDYLEMLKVDIFKYIEDTSFGEYLDAINKFSHSLISLMKTMVSDEMRNTGKTITDLLNEEGGWEKFRFSDAQEVVITFKEDFEAKRIHVIPYYGEKSRGVWETDPFVFDVDELLLIRDLDWRAQKMFLCLKGGSVRGKILDINAYPIPLRGVNSPHYVNDWKLLGV